MSLCVYGFIEKKARGRKRLTETKQQERVDKKVKTESVRGERKVKYRAKSFKKKKDVLCHHFLSPHRKMRREMSDSVVYGWGGWWKTAERLSIQQGIRVWPDRGGLPANFLNSANGKEKNFIWNTSSSLSVFLLLSCPIPSISLCLSHWSLGFSMQVGIVMSPAVLLLATVFWHVTVCIISTPVARWVPFPFWLYLFSMASHTYGCRST